MPKTTQKDLLDKIMSNVDEDKDKKKEANKAKRALPKSQHTERETLQLGKDLADGKITFEEWDRRVKLLLEEQQQLAEDRRTSLPPPPPRS